MNMDKISAIIIDDEQDSVSFIASLIDEYCENIDVAGKAFSVDGGLKIIEEKKPQLLFLDVEMPDGTGFNLLEQLGDVDFHVIFITAYNHYALQAIKFSAVDYILKPINIKEFLAAVQKVSDVIRNKQNFSKQFSALLENLNSRRPAKIGLPQLDGIEFVEATDIVRIKAEGSYSRIFLKDSREILMSKNLGEFQELLLGRPFFRPHNSHLINLEFVKKYVKSDGGYIIMDTEDSVPLSKSRRQAFLDMMPFVGK